MAPPSLGVMICLGQGGLCSRHNKYEVVSIFVHAVITPRTVILYYHSHCPSQLV